MEPRHEESQKTLEPSARPKRKRFHIVKLEERIAPSQGGGTKNCHRTMKPFTCQCPW
jgi:hypothetical protein